LAQKSTIEYILICLRWAYVGLENVKLKISKSNMEGFLVSSCRARNSFILINQKITSMKKNSLLKGWLRNSLTALLLVGSATALQASSHREAPLIANDPLADNTDLYAFRSPDNPNRITIIANYIPAELPYGGPNYASFGENIRYEIHINNTGGAADNIIYRFTFTQTNQDPTTFFDIRLGKENNKTTYICEKSTNGGSTFTTIVSAGIVPPPNIGARSISSAVGLGVADYNTLITGAIATATTGESVFCGPADDPFFVDLGGIFDLGDAPRQGSTVRDGLAKKNVHSIAIQVDISALQKSGQSVAQATSILDPNYVVGIWASASRLTTKTLNTTGGGSAETGNWVQVSRLGMPLTNEAVIPIGYKDLWNSMTPYQDLDSIHTFGNFFYNPELALYMDTDYYAGAVPAFAALRIQHQALGAYDFGNGKNGLYGLKGNPALAGTAFDPTTYGSLLLPAANEPRSVDLWPIFNTGVPNLPPYQLATGKNGNPLAVGKPFINNFLPTGGDMLRLNMAVTPTSRTSADFSSEGIIYAAVLGLTDARFNGSDSLQLIPNMDGFPNGRRLEDDVTRIELQAVSGVALAAIGLWYDDYDYQSPNASPVTNYLKNVLQYSTGVEKNDTTFKTSFPYVQTPWRGTAVTN
jgi:hypothetical protein